MNIKVLAKQFATGSSQDQMTTLTCLVLLVFFVRKKPELKIDCIPEIGQILTVNGKRIFPFLLFLLEINLGHGITSLKKLDWMLKSGLEESCFFEANLQGKRGDVRMVRVSDCKYLVAAIYKSSVCIQKTEVFVDLSSSTESVEYIFWKSLLIMN